MLSMAPSLPGPAVTSGGEAWDFPGSRLADLHRSLPASHPLGDRDPEQVQPGQQDPQGERGQRQPAVPDGRLGRLEHRALLVERGERAGHLEQEAGQQVRLRGLPGLPDRGAEPERRQRQRQVGPARPAGPGRRPPSGLTWARRKMDRIRAVAYCR